MCALRNPPTKSITKWLEADCEKKSWIKVLMWKNGGGLARKKNVYIESEKHGTREIGGGKEETKKKFAEMMIISVCLSAAAAFFPLFLCHCHSRPRRLKCTPMPFLYIAGQRRFLPPAKDARRKYIIYFRICCVSKKWARKTNSVFLYVFQLIKMQ